RNGDGARINISKLNKLHEALRQRVVKVLLEDTSSSRSGIGYRHVRSVMDLVEGENVSGVLNLPFNVIIRREYDYIMLSRDEECRHSSGSKREEREAPEGTKAQDFSYPLQIPGNIDISEAHMTLAFRFIHPEEIDFGTEDAVFMDYDKMSPPLIIRNMREGDRIQPFGMEGTKKLKDLFVDRKIPRGRRGDIPLLVDQKGVVWLPKVKLSQRVKITDMTEKVVKAEII
ncbi:MAG: hypothetical protein E4H39_00500, partial [Syntrophobacterales bacterium]